MSTKFYVIAVWTLLSFVVKVNAQDKVECWDRFELSFKQVTKGNPFDTRLSATFICGKEKKTVEGFYDGENTYRIRFMPAGRRGMEVCYIFQYRSYEWSERYIHSGTRRKR